MDKPVDDQELMPEKLQADDVADSKKRESRKRRYLICFSCNRVEGHFLVTGRRWFFSYLLGLSFGLILLIGPYRCQCCGASRLMYFESLNPRYWLHMITHGKSPKLRNRRSKGRS